jgi:hypothetical protein
VVSVADVLGKATCSSESRGGKCDYECAGGAFDVLHELALSAAAHAFTYDHDVTVHFTQVATEPQGT